MDKRSGLQPCGGCKRHIAAAETCCPFCGEATASTALRELPLGRLSRAAVFAAAALATGASCGGKTKPADRQIEPQELDQDRRNRGCVDPDPAEIERLEQRRAEAQTDEDKAAIDQELERARMPVCMPYGAPPARRRTV